MALPSWPADLPQDPLVDGFAIPALAQPPLRTRLDDGPDRVRRKRLTRTSTVVQRYKLTAYQTAVFQNFLEDGVNQGARRFTMPVRKPHNEHFRRVRTVQIGAVALDPIGSSASFLTLTLTVWDY